MNKPNKSSRKYIRKEKARIRKSGVSTEEKKDLINSIYKKHHDHKRDLQPSDKKGSRE